MLFDFDTLTINKLVVEAAEIVEKLVGNDAFFLHTFGSVLRLIAGESLIVKSNITDEDILQIRTNLECTVFLRHGTTANIVHGVRSRHAWYSIRYNYESLYKISGTS